MSTQITPVRSPNNYNSNISYTGGNRNAAQQVQNNPGLMTQFLNYPVETAEIMLGGEMPSNMATFNNNQSLSGIGDVTPWNMDNGISLADIGGVSNGTGIGTALSGITNLLGGGTSGGSGGSGGLMGLIGTGMNIYNMFQNNKRADEMLGFARESADRAKQQWGITLEELGRIKRVRQNISNGYQTGNYAEQYAKNPSERPSKYVS